MMRTIFSGERKIIGKEKTSIATLVKHSFLSVAVSAAHATHNITNALFMSCQFLKANL